MFKDPRLLVPWTARSRDPRAMAASVGLQLQAASLELCRALAVDTAQTLIAQHGLTQLVARVDEQTARFEVTQDELAAQVRDMTVQHHALVDNMPRLSAAVDEIRDHVGRQTRTRSTRRLPPMLTDRATQSFGRLWLERRSRQHHPFRKHHRSHRRCKPRESAPPLRERPRVHLRPLPLDHAHRAGTRVVPSRRRNPSLTAYL